MASVTKRPRSKFWVACFTDRNGRRLKRSTKITNRKEAQKKTDEYEQAWRQKKTALQFRRIMTEGYRSLTDGDVSHASVRAFFDSWTRHRDGYERWPFTVDQLRTVLSVADPEWKSMILCGLYTGQRLSDIADAAAPLHPRAHAIVTAQGKRGHLSNQFADLLAQVGLRKKTPQRPTSNQGRSVHPDRENRLSFHASDIPVSLF